METLILTCGIIITILVIIATIILTNKYYNRKQRKEYENEFFYNLQDPYNDEERPIYQRKYLLTKHEWAFYQELKEIADDFGYIVLAKIRMADLVEPVNQANHEYMSAFGKIKAKHVDFALAKKENMYVELLIELDDRSHIPGNERDAFVEYVYAQTGYKLLRYWDGQNLRQMVTDALFSKTSS